MPHSRVTLPAVALLLWTSGCIHGDPANHLERQLEGLTSPSQIGTRPIVRLAIAPLMHETHRAPGELEVLKGWAKQIETDELVEHAIVLSPKVYNACKGEASTGETRTECELREAVRAATRSSADALVLARTEYFVPPAALPLPFIPHKPAEIVTYGALLEIDAGTASLLRYERASIELGATQLSQQRVRSIEGFLKAVCNSLVENADELRHVQREKVADPQGEAPVE